MSSFDEPKHYYVFKYVVDKVTGEPTEYEGQVQDVVMATDPWAAVEAAGFNDMNVYGANRIDNLEKFETAIKNERTLLRKISKGVKVMADALRAERQKFKEERPCPNGCGQMDEQYRCEKCGFGFEAEQLYDDVVETIEELEETIADETAKGNDTKELEAMRDSLRQQIGL